MISLKVFASFVAFLSFIAVIMYLTWDNVHTLSEDAKSLMVNSLLFSLIGTFISFIIFIWNL